MVLFIIQCQSPHCSVESVVTLKIVSNSCFVRLFQESFHDDEIPIFLRSVGGG